jgi:ring-1,2-phenylacetyl-CoA epoxidase subunit PaaD
MVKQLQKSTQDLESLVWQIASDVPDPEIPVITLGELGIVRAVTIDDSGAAVVQLSPTYSGCPAVQVIEDNVVTALKNQGITGKVERVISPPWTTDWINEAGRQKLTDYGIAPPEKSSLSKPALFARDAPGCPRCKSKDTKLVSQFGSTPCKAHYQCAACLEPFDYFKCL